MTLPALNEEAAGPLDVVVDVVRLATRLPLFARPGRETDGPCEFLRAVSQGPEEGDREDSVNNFQGRYAIRHPWTGPIACQNPLRGRWGGPPGEPWQKPAPEAAQDLAFAPRGKVELAALVREDVPELGLMVAAGAVVQQAVVMDRLPEPAEAPVEPAKPEVAEAPPVEPPPAGQGCACAAADASPPPALLALGLLGLLARRRREPA